MAEQVGIVGAGLAGLSCAYYLEKQGYDPILFEKEAEPGGRLSTERYEGYILDRGFQVLLTSYEEVKKILRLYELNLGRFPAGANVYYQGQWYPFYNPLKHPLSVLQNRQLPFVSFADKVKLGSLYFKSAFKSSHPHFQSGRPSTLAFLKEQGFSDAFIEAAIRPFFGGVLLDPALQASDEVFLWLLHFFMEGVAALPRQGMQALARAIAGKLKKTTFRYNTAVSAVHGQSVYLQGGAEVVCDKIAIATDAEQARAFIGSLPELGTRTVTCLYFTVDSAVFAEPPSPLLHLNGEGTGPINNVAFDSLVQPSYAPAGKLLLSVTVIAEEWQTAPDLSAAVTEQLSRWFGLATHQWRHLKSYCVTHALPDQSQPPPLQGLYQIDRHPDIYLCGEYVDHASINGALASGRRAAEAIHEGIQRVRSLTKET